MIAESGWMSLANMRENGVRAVTLWCHCGRHIDVNVDHLPEDLKVPAIREQYRCAQCNLRPKSSRPAWHTRP
nr:hypothetical protein [uncultured organism]